MTKCQYHAELQQRIEKIDDKQDHIAEDIAVIKNVLTGDDGMVKKVARHDKYFYMAGGGTALIGFVMAILRIVK